MPDMASLYPAGSTVHVGPGGRREREPERKRLKEITVKQPETATPYLTRSLLIEVSRRGHKWDFNRQLSERIAEVPGGNYPVELFFVHRHRHGEPSEPHIRTVISLEPFSNAFVVADVPIEFFDKLPRFTPRNGKKASRRKLTTVRG
jgi:hypothetical protein